MTDFSLQTQLLGEEEEEEQYELIMERTKSRSSSLASIEELGVEGEDFSLLRAGELINLSKCEDETFIANAYKYCQRCLGGSWAQCSADKFSVEYLSGGMTNYLYLCSLDEDIITEAEEPRKVLIRIYGSIVDQKHRFYEGVIFTLLSERGYGPATLGVFYSGRIEEFIPHRHLFRCELYDPRISKLIAKRVGEYHCMRLPLNKAPTFLWESIEKYVDMCNGLVIDEDVFSSTEPFDYESEYQWLKHMLISLKCPVVFCHNDVQEGNILYIDNDDDAALTDIKLIDFDYSGYNYRAYDIANHFCEFMYEYSLGGENRDGFIVHEKDFPSEAQQIRFAEEYCATLDDYRVRSSQRGYDSKRNARVIPECNVEKLLYEVNRFALASHFYWGLWSIIQHQVSKIEFAYLKYAKSRFDQYFRKKAELGY